MTNSELQIKFKQRLNKLASLDYDNIECWQMVEAFNKAQLLWLRRQIQGYNARQQGDEGSKMLIDDLQKLLRREPLVLTTGVSWSDSPLPADYLYFKRLSVQAKSDCCPARQMSCSLAEEADVDVLMADVLMQPNYAWGETFCTLAGGGLRVYTDGGFEITGGLLVYYRHPRPIAIAGCGTLNGDTPALDVTCELKDDLAELVLDEAVGIIAEDLEMQLRQQASQTSVARNT